MLDDGSFLAGGTASWQGWVVCVDGDLRGTWDLPLANIDNVHALTSLSGGDFAIAASAEGSTTAFGVTSLSRFAGNRKVRWQKRLPNSGRGEPAALAALSDGGLAVVGHYSRSERDKAQLWVVRLSTSGEVSWEEMLGPAGEERRGRAIVPLNDGVALAGDALQQGRRKLCLARLSADGSVIWEHVYGGDGTDVARGLAKTDDGGLVLVCSTTAKGPGHSNIWILRLDADGGLVWDRVFGAAE